MVASAVPSPAVKVKPLRLASVSVPLLAVSVTRTLDVPASMSSMLIRLPFPVEKMSGVSSLVDCAPATVFTGASLTALTVMATVSTSL